MKAVELLQKHPETTLKIREFFLNKMLQSIKEKDEVPEEFKQVMIDKGVNDDQIVVLIEVQPRLFFDFFDSIEKVIQITYKKGFGFSWSVENETCNIGFDTRLEAERDAIYTVFEMLEPSNEISEN